MTGTQAATVVEKLQGHPVSTTAPANGQVLTWNGTASKWEPQAIATATIGIADVRSSVAGAFLTGTGCTAGQALTYNSVSDTMSCASISLTSSQVTTALGYTPARTDRAQSFLGQQNSAIATLIGPSVSWDLDRSNVFNLTLAANASVSITNGMVAGGTYMMIVFQSTAGNTITWDSAIKWPNGTPVQPSSGSGTWSIYSFVSDGTRLFAVGVTNYM